MGRLLTPDHGCTQGLPIKTARYLGACGIQILVRALQVW